MSEKLRNCVKSGQCTFRVTGKERHGQPYWRRATISEDGYTESMQGYCLACKERCYPSHSSQHRNLKWTLSFSGNFYCLCGAGGELDKMSVIPCFAE